MPQRPKTYVLIGPDQVRADEFYSARDDVVIIRPQKGKTIAQLLEQIRTPANIILQCHGAKGETFRWNPKGGRTSYAQFFDALPRSGVLSVMLGSCYGGDAQAQHMLKHAPAGCIVQSMVGEKMVNLTNTIWLFAQETRGLAKPIDLFLEALDNFNSERYEEFMVEYNKKYPRNPYGTNPDKALPHILGIGGEPGVQINLNDEMRLLTGKVDKDALARAVQRVQARFDTQAPRTKVDANGVRYPALAVVHTLGGSAERKLDMVVAVMAYNLQQGYIPETVEEKRIAFGVIAAYLDESGELQRRVEAVPNYMPLQKRDAYGKRIPQTLMPTFLPMAADATRLAHVPDKMMFSLPAKVESPHPSKVTAMEQGYLNSVQMRLMADPDMKEIVGALQKNFERSANDDPLSGPLKLQLQAHGLSTKSWER